MAVVDSSVLIHLVRVGRLNLLRDFFKEIYITPEVKAEVVDAEVLKVGASRVAHSLESWIKIASPKGRSNIARIIQLEKIEPADASIILLAEARKDILLSNDSFLIKVAEARGVECWWLTNFLLKCLRKKIINKNEAKEIFYNLVINKMYISPDVYAAILREIEKF